MTGLMILDKERDVIDWGLDRLIRGANLSGHSREVRRGVYGAFQPPLRLYVLDVFVEEKAPGIETIPLMLWNGTCMDERS